MTRVNTDFESKRARERWRKAIRKAIFLGRFSGDSTIRSKARKVLLQKAPGEREDEDLKVLRQLTSGELRGASPSWRAREKERSDGRTLTLTLTPTLLQTLTY